MLTYNTMRFGTDEFTPYIKWALLDSQDLALDLTDYNFIERFNIAGAEPTGTQRRFMFRVDDKVYTFDGQTPVEYTGELTVNDVLEYGNTAAQVEAVKNFRTWGGKKIYPIIALYTEVEDTPSVKLTANAVTGDEILDYDNTQASSNKLMLPSGVTENIKILGIEYEPNIVGDASAELTAAYTLNHEPPYSWSEYLPLDEIIGKEVYRITFRYKLHVGAVNGTNCAQIGKVKLIYSADATSVVCGETAELYTIRKNYHISLKNCVVILKHNELLSGAGFDVYYHVMPAMILNERINLGTGTGQYQNLQLPTNKFFRPYSFHLYYDGVETDDYNFDTELNEVHLNAPEGVGITAYYYSGIREENWVQMTPDETQPDISDGKYVTRYAATFPEGSNRVSMIKIVFKRPLEGDPTVVTFTATGALQEYVCTYQPDNIDCDAEEWDYDSATRILSFSSPTGNTVTIKYSKQAPNPILYGFTVGWAV